MSNAMIFDTETTGLKDPVLVEAAWLMLGNPAERVPTWRKPEEQRYNPGKRIELCALATHHILDEELTECPPASEFRLPAGIEYIIGHNIDFDWKVIGEPDVKRICTKALATSLFPGLDSYSQSALIYFLERDLAKIILRNAHSAAADVASCCTVLLHLFLKLEETGWLQKETTWEDIWIISEQARIPTMMPFGKHKGTLIKDVPESYIRWLLDQPDTMNDTYLTQSLLRTLNARNT